MTTDPDKSISETQRHPGLLLIAQTFLEIYPSMSFEELVLRIFFKKSPEDISPHDREVLSRIHVNPKEAIAYIKEQLEQNLSPGPER